MTLAVLYAIAVLAGGGVLLLAASHWLKPRWSALASLALAAAALSISVLVHSGTLELALWHWLPTGNWSILVVYRFDTISQVLGLLAACSSLLLLFWMVFMDEEGAFAPWVLLLLAIFLHLLASADLTLAYASWELLLLTTYFMLVFRRRALPTPGIAEWFLGGQHVAGYMLLFALFLIGRATGTTLYPTLDLGAIGLVPLLLLLGTIWIRTAQVPFQGWALAAAESPGPVHTLLLGGSTLLAGPYLWLRFLSRAGEHAPHEVAMIMGAISLVLGAVLALRRESSRQVQAGDTVSRLGLVWVALGLDSQLGLAAGLLLLADLVLTKVLFHAALSSGRSVERPVRQGLFLLGAWGALGLPPSPGFLGRWLLIVGLLRIGRPAYVPLILLSLPLTVAYLWRGWTLLPTAQDRPEARALLGARIAAGLLALLPLTGLAVPWIWKELLERATIAVTGVASVEVQPLLKAMAGANQAWTLLLLFVGALGAWWLGAWRRRPAPVATTAPALADGGSAVEEAAPQAVVPMGEGPLQEALPVLNRESDWLAWIGRPAQLYGALAQSLARVGQLSQSVVNFLERHTTYFLLVVLVAATALLIVLTR